MLRISGELLDVNLMISECNLVPYRTWQRNEERIIKGKKFTDSGASFVVSEADFDDFPTQVAEAIDFIDKNLSTVKNMATFAGTQSASLDFGVSLNEGYVAHFCHLPSHLIKIAASAGLAVEISHYACSNDEEV